MSGSFVCDRCHFVFYHICDPDDIKIDAINPKTGQVEILCDKCFDSLHEDSSTTTGEDHE